MRHPPLRSALFLALAVALGSGPSAIGGRVQAKPQPQAGSDRAPRSLPAVDDGIVVRDDARGSGDSPAEADGLRPLRGALAGPEDTARDALALPDQGSATPICVWTALASGALVAGSLADTDCRWGQLVGPDAAFQLDPARADVYTIDLTERSALAIELTPAFDAAISLRDAGFGRLREVQAPTDQPTTLNATLPAGRYTIGIRAALQNGAVGGDYAVRATVTPAPSGAPCEPGSIEPSGVVTGILQPGCAIFDWLPDQSFDNAAQLYELILDEPGDVALTLTASDSTFAPLLTIMTEDRTRDIALDASGGAGDPTPNASALDAGLPAGRYWVMVAAAQPGGTGAFTLASQFDSAAGKCTILPGGGAALTFGATITATLVADGCRTGYLSTALSQNAPASVHRVFVPQGGEISFGLQASGFVPFVQLLNARFQSIPGVGTLPLNNGARINIRGPRDFLVVVQGENRATGDVQLTVAHALSGNACSLQDIAASGTAMGALEVSDCTLEDWLNYRDASRVDLYAVHLPTRGRLKITHRSDAFAPYLWLIARDSYFYIPRDDNLTGNESTIEEVLDAGHYLIGANSVVTSAGDYTLTTQFTPEARPATCLVAPLAVPAIVDAELSGAECRLFDVDPRSHWPSPVDRYRVTLPSYAELTVTASSDTFHVRASILDADTLHDAVIAFGGELPAEASAVARLPPGNYFIDIDDAFRYYNDLGPYHLEVSQILLPDPRPCEQVDLATLPGSLLEPGYAIEGELADTDCVVGDFPKTTLTQFPVDTVTVTIPQRGTLTIDLRSDAFDPRLDVLNWAYDLVLQHDDVDVDLDRSAHIESRVGPGLYRIQALSVDMLHGPYTLEVVFQPDPYTPPADVTPTPSATGGATQATPTPTMSTPGTPTPSPTAGTPGPPLGWRIYLPFAGKDARLRP